MKIPECSTYYNDAILQELVFSMINKKLMLRANAGRQEKNLVSFISHEFLV